jgi:GT2 family glycosyltransferase
MPAISVVILTFNSQEYINSCLASLFSQSYRDFEAVVVDNGSQDNTLGILRGDYPGIRVIANSKNLGAARARNQGIESSAGRWILTLDCDVELKEGFLGEIAGCAEKIPGSTGMVQPKILTRGGEKIYSCGITRSWLKRFHDLGRGLPDLGNGRVTGHIFGACSAAALYRREMLEEIKDRYGYFDERFFFLFEDADLSWRARKKGWGCAYCPSAECRHRGDSSSTEKRVRQYLSFRNRQLTIMKNQNPVMILFMLPFYLVYDLPRFLILAVKFKRRFPEF